MKRKVQSIPVDEEGMYMSVPVNHNTLEHNIICSFGSAENAVLVDTFF